MGLRGLEIKEGKIESICRAMCACGRARGGGGGGIIASGVGCQPSQSRFLYITVGREGWRARAQQFLLHNDRHLCKTPCQLGEAT